MISQSVSNGQRDFDHLLMNIFDDLSADLIHTVQDATHQILEISSHFLQTDISHAIQDFHALYEKNVELDTYKESIGKNIDEIIHYIQSDQGDPSKAPDLRSIDTEQLEASRLSLSNLHKDMEALARLDTGMKEEVLPILHNMQFEDQLTANVLIITHAWKTFVEKTDGNCDSALLILQDVYSKLGSARLRGLFCEHVLRTEQELECVIPDDVLEDCLTSLESEDDFFARMQEFCTSVFAWSSEDSAASVDLIFEVIKNVEHEAEAAGDFSDDTHDAFASLKEVATGLNNPATRESTKIMISLLKNRMTVNDSVQSLIKPVMIAMQFQDRIRQNMENLCKTMDIWLTRRKELCTETGELKTTLREQVGIDLMSHMTMESERRIVKKFIPEAPESVDSNDDLELF